MPLVVLLARAHTQGLSGSVVVGRGGQPLDAVYVQRGVPAKASTSEVVAPLGETLVAMGAIDEAALVDGYEIACDRRVLLGESLVERGLIDRDLLNEALRSQLEAKVLSLLNRPRIPCRFIEDTDVLEGYGEALEVGGEPLALIMEGVRRLRRHPHLTSTLESFGDAHLVIRLDERIERMGLRLEVPVVDRLLEGPVTRDELFAERVATEEVTSHAIYALALVGFVDRVRDLSPSERIRRDSRTRPHAVRRGGRLSRAEVHQRLCDIEELPGAQALGVPPEATVDEVWDAFLAETCRWHPDNLPSELCDLRPEVERIFACIAESYAARRRLAPQRSTETSLCDAMDALELFQKANAAVEAENLAKAEALVRRALALEPLEIEYRTLLAAVMAKRAGEPAALGEGETTNRYAVPIRMLEHVLADEPEYERARLQRGILMAQSGRHREALADFEHILRFNPQHAGAATRAKQARLAITRSREAGRPPARKTAGGGTAPPGAIIGAIRLSGR